LANRVSTVWPDEHHHDLPIDPEKVVDELAKKKGRMNFILQRTYAYQLMDSRCVGYASDYTLMD